LNVRAKLDLNGAPVEVTLTLDAAALTEIAAYAVAPPYLSVAEAAVYLRCDRHRIYDLLSARRLTRFKDGTRTLVSRDELNAHLRRETRP
jgi:excisionase family DNA binding protein